MKMPDTFNSTEKNRKSGAPTDQSRAPHIHLPAEKGCGGIIPHNFLFGNSQKWRIIVDVITKIEAQQKGRENTGAWMVGEQLKDICRQDPSCADIVAADLENKDMSLEKAEGKIRAKADELRRTMKGADCVCVPPNVAEDIIREFYGLPAAGGKPKICSSPVTDQGMISLEDFL